MEEKGNEEGRNEGNEGKEGHAGRKEMQEERKGGRKGGRKGEGKRGERGKSRFPAEVVLPSFFPFPSSPFLPSVLSPLFPSFLTLVPSVVSTLPSFSFYPFFLPSFLLSFLRFLPSFLPSFLPFLTSRPAIPPFLTSHRPPFLRTPLPLSSVLLCSCVQPGSLFLGCLERDYHATK